MLLTTAAAAATPEVEIRRDGAAYVVRAHADLDADQRTAWATVTDYEHLPEFVPGIRSAQVLARVAAGGSERLLVEQSGEFRFLWFSEPVHVWLDVSHDAPARVLAQAVTPSGTNPARSTVREFEGSYTFAPLDGGRTRFRHEARFAPAHPPLPIIGDLVIRHVIAEQFAAMVAEIERRAAQGRGARVWR